MWKEKSQVPETESLGALTSVEDRGEFPQAAKAGRAGISEAKRRKRFKRRAWTSLSRVARRSDGITVQTVVSF